MFEELKERFLRKFMYVRVLESDRDHLCDMAEKYEADLKKAQDVIALEKEQKEVAMSIIKIMLDKPTMIFSDRVNNRYITVSENDINEYKDKSLNISSMFPVNAIKVCVKKDV